MPVVAPAIKSTGEYRKEVYALFEEIVGRAMTSEEHEKLKAILKDYLAEHRVVVDSSKPHEHIFTCANCRKAKRVVGHQATKRMKKYIIDEVDNEPPAVQKGVE